MIFTENFYDWISFEEDFETEGYRVIGELMTCPDPVNHDPIIHDLNIEEIICLDSFSDLTNQIAYDKVWADLEKRVL